MTKLKTEEIPQDCANQLDTVLDSDLFKCLSEPIRCKILRIVALNGPIDVMGVSEYFSQDRSVISRHLSQMCSAGILKSEKKSRSKLYWIDGEVLLNKLEEMTETVRNLVRCEC